MLKDNFSPLHLLLLLRVKGGKRFKEKLTQRKKSRQKEVSMCLPLRKTKVKGDSEVSFILPGKHTYPAVFTWKQTDHCKGRLLLGKV